ncbi:MAG: MBL fold metallo-hydrolase [Desulfurococcaceae archaeon]
MIISWHGHACVSVQVNGYTIVIDPHDGLSIGLKKPATRADLVLVTHDHFDHNAVNAVSKDKTRVLKMHYGETFVDSLRVVGLRSYHDKSKGRRRGENAVYVIEVKGARLAHLGDIGDIPEELVLEKLKGVDLLMVPVGGTFTIEPEEAWSLVEKTKPVNVMPIHYWITGLMLPLKPVDEFLKLVKGYNVVKLDTNSFNLAEFRNSVIVVKPP